MGEFSVVSKDGRLKALNTIFIDFNNGTVIGMYVYEDYGNVEKEIEILGSPVYLTRGLNYK